VVTVYGIVPGSDSDKLGVKAGDILHTVNECEVNDVLDYRFYLTDTKVRLTLERDGELYQIEIRKEMYADIGLEFETYLMDKKRSCRNRCIFCFIDQLPKGMRETLYFKDDDSRLSFLMGNYVTLTNLSDKDVDRIVKMHISPINVSVHTTNPELRVEMMKNKRAGEVLKYLDRFKEAGIELNLQIVLCRGINDGNELTRSMTDLAELYPAVTSVSVVPSGLTKHRQGLYPLTPFTPKECAEVIDQVTAFGDKCVEKYGTRLFYLGDEFYIKSGRALPNEEFYEGYPQIENGVGMIRSLRSEFLLELEELENGSAEPFSIATGVAAAPYIESLVGLAKKKSPSINGTVFAIENEFFGYTVDVAGLVTGKDLISQLEGKDLGKRLLIPATMLRHGGDVFLDDVTPQQVDQALGVKLECVMQDGAALAQSIFGLDVM